jgi:hypothetical protein
MKNRIEEYTGSGGICSSIPQSGSPDFVDLHASNPLRIVIDAPHSIKEKMIMLDLQASNPMMQDCLPSASPHRSRTPAPCLLSPEQQHNRVMTMFGAASLPRCRLCSARKTPDCWPTVSEVYRPFGARPSTRIRQENSSQINPWRPRTTPLTVRARC